jgi:D-serine deaminase-like pyridoxal phosphate-dependent protein
MNEDNTWYKVNNIEEIDSPALLVFPERVKENIQILKGMIDDPQRLRPHVKTHKTKEAALLMMEADIQKFKCATIAEAEMLGMAGALDVLLAYQPVGPKLYRFLSLIKKYPSTMFSCLIDNFNSAASVAEAAFEAKLEIPVYIDLNAGMGRTGITPGRDAIQLYLQCTSLRGLILRGLHAYDGHIHDSSLQIRKKRCNEAFLPVLKLRDSIIEKGYPEPVIVAGGSPTFPILAAYKNIECSPGTFVFWDKGYENAFAEQQFKVAALVVTRVVSFPGRTKICLDLGHKSIASENELQKRVTFLNAPELKVISQSEEHLVVEAPEGHAYRTGDVLYGVPFHICPTCALYERASTVENGSVSGEWKIIARDRKITV